MTIKQFRRMGLLVLCQRKRPVNRVATNRPHSPTFQRQGSTETKFFRELNKVRDLLQTWSSVIFPSSGNLITFPCFLRPGNNLRYSDKLAEQIEVRIAIKSRLLPRCLPSTFPVHSAACLTPRNEFPLSSCVNSSAPA